MEEVTTSNLMLSMPSSRSVLREQALAAWRFEPSHTAKDQDADTAWIFKASQRDMEIVTRALVRELNSRPDEGVIVRTTNEKKAEPPTSQVASSSSSSCDPGSPSQAAVKAIKASTSVEVWDSMADQSESPGTRTPPVEALSRFCNNQRSILAVNNFIRKRQSRKRKRSPSTNMRADPADLQALVQQVTGFPLESSNRATPSLLKPQPKRPGRIRRNTMPSALPTLDSPSLRFPVAINGLFGTRPNCMNPGAFCNNFAENSVYSADTTASSSHLNSVGMDKARIN